MYLSLSSSHACRFGINGLVGEPQPRVHMLDITNGVSILDLWDPHALWTQFRARVKLLLWIKAYYSITQRDYYDVNDYKIFLLSIPYHCALLTLDGLKQKEVALRSALSLSTRCRPLSSVRPRYRPVVMWQRRKGCPQCVCLPLHLRKMKSRKYFCFFPPCYCTPGIKKGTHSPNSILGQCY